MNCIIVDDEPLAIEVIESYLKKIDSIKLVGTFRNAIKAFEFIQNNSVDLIFLDIQMPKLTGIDFLKSFQNLPKIILTTAYREYAIEGYELEIVDYLLKPISFERFMKAIGKVMNQQKLDSTNSQSFKEKKEENPFIFFKSEKKMVKVFLYDILYVESIKDYVKIKTPEKETITHQKISTMNESLPNKSFIRIHRSFIINIEKIDCFSATEVEINGESLPIGRSYKNDTLRRLESIVL
jgi:DNA-binding LytR/AlgR family response regulator